MAESLETLDPAHQDALRRLRRWFRAPGGRLVVAVGADPAIRAEVARALGEVAVLELDPDEPAPWEILVRHRAQLVLAVLPPDSPHSLLQRLNVGREQVARQGLRLILWLSSLSTMDGLRLAAPDLWAHRSGWLPFLSEADLPAPAGPLPPSVDEQLAELEARIASWPAEDKVGRFQAEANAVWLLTEAGHLDGARERQRSLELGWRKLPPFLRWMCRPHLEQARTHAHAERAPHERLSALDPERLSDTPEEQLLAWVTRLAMLNRLGWLNRSKAEVSRQPPPGLDQSGRAAWRFNQSAHLASAAINTADLATARRAIDQLWPAFSELNDESRAFQEARARKQLAVQTVQASLIASDWLDALREVHTGASVSQAGGAGTTYELLDLGLRVARDAGLLTLAEAWTDRALLLAQRAGPTAEARLLTSLLTSGTLSAARQADLVPRALDLAPQIRDFQLSCDLQAAAGVAGAPEPARSALRRRLRRHGYERFCAGRALARMERALCNGVAAADATHAAMDYASKYGGFALRAELWLDLATAGRLAGQPDLVEEALAQAARALAEVDEALHPAELRATLAREQGARHQGRGEGELADRALWTEVERLRDRGARSLAQRALVDACRFGGPRRAEAGQAALELALEIGLPALEADALLEQAALAAEAGNPDSYALDRARWWIERIGSRADRRRLHEVLAMHSPARG